MRPSGEGDITKWGLVAAALVLPHIVSPFLLLAVAENKGELRNRDTR